MKILSIPQSQTSIGWTKTVRSQYENRLWGWLNRLVPCPRPQAGDLGSSLGAGTGGPYVGLPSDEKNKLIIGSIKIFETFFSLQNLFSKLRRQKKGVFTLLGG